MQKRAELPIVIAGGGVVGLTAACLLAEAKIPVLLLETKSAPIPWSSDVMDVRVVALTRASQHLLQGIGVWPGIAQRRIAAYRYMQVWDGEGTGAIRFSADEIGDTDLGHIVELSAMETSLIERLQQYSHASLRYGVSVREFTTQADKTTVTLSDDSRLSTRLLIAADGAHSRLRELAGIAVHSEAYQHHAIIAQIHCEQPHQHTAWQRFTRSGPLALLPLSDVHQCSIVWSIPPDETARYLALDDDAFSATLSQAFEHRLGALRVMSPRFQFPLLERQAERYIADRFALLGDAAHTMHPLAGQGLNVSLADVACLTGQLIKAVSAGVDIGSTAILRRYERERRSESALMLSIVKGFKRLFTEHELPMVLLRNAGMSQLNQHPLAKSLIIRRAMGLQ